MARINRPVKGIHKTVTHEGGPTQLVLNPATELERAVMACLLWEKSFYCDGKDIAERIGELVGKCAFEDVARIAVAAKDSGIRHAPLLVAVHAAKKFHSRKVGDLIYNVIRRADELAELLSLYFDLNKQPDGKRPKIAKQVKLGLARAFRKFDGYQLAKYNRDTAVKLKDVLFLVHAKPQDAAQEALWKQLIDGNLSTPDTWETELSAGKGKLETFTRLMREKKLGGLAALRNCRNMIDAGISAAAIGDYLKGVRPAMPWQYIACLNNAPGMAQYLDQQLVRSCGEVPRLPGKTVVVVDVSGSMGAPLSSRSQMTRLSAASGLSVILAHLCQEMVLYTFSQGVVQVPALPSLGLVDAIYTSQQHGGTYLGGALQTIQAKHQYDRLIVLTDEQSHDAVGQPTGKGYMVNVATERPSVAHGQWIAITGFSANLIQWIVKQELGRDLVVDEE